MKRTWRDLMTIRDRAYAQLIKLRKNGSHDEFTHVMLFRLAIDADHLGRRLHDLKGLK